MVANQKTHRFRAFCQRPGDLSRLLCDPFVVRMRRAAGQRLADLLWPGRDPIGQRLQLQSTAQADVWWTVVGVSAPVLHHHLDGEPGFDWYRLAPACLLAVGAWLVVRTHGAPGTIAQAVRGVVSRIDRDLAVEDVATVDAVVAGSMWRQRFATMLLGPFAGAALLLRPAGRQCTVTAS